MDSPIKGPSAWPNASANGPNRPGSGDARFVDEWHQETGLEEMVDHQVLSEDAQVRRSVFGNGRAVTVNLAKEPRQVEGREMAGESYRIE